MPGEALPKIGDNKKGKKKKIQAWMTWSHTQREQSQCVCCTGKHSSDVDVFKAQVIMLALYSPVM